MDEHYAPRQHLVRGGDAGKASRRSTILRAPHCRASTARHLTRALAGIVAAPASAVAIAAVFAAVPVASVAIVVVVIMTIAEPVPACTHSSLERHRRAGRLHGSIVAIKMAIPEPFQPVSSRAWHTTGVLGGCLLSPDVATRLGAVGLCGKAAKARGLSTT